MDLSTGIWTPHALEQIAVRRVSREAVEAVLQAPVDVEEIRKGRVVATSPLQIDGKSYPISHRWENVPIHLVSYQLDLDRRTPGVAGAAAAAGAPR